MREALVVIGHGSRLARANDELREIAEMVRASGAYDIVEAAFLSNDKPRIGEAIAACAEEGAERIIALPYFLFEAGHVRIDVPQQVRKAAAKTADVEIRLAPHLGPDPRIARLLADRANAACAGTPAVRRKRKRYLVLVARGSSDPGLEEGLARMAMRVGVFARFTGVSHGFTDIRRPAYREEAARLVDEEGASAVVLQPCMLYSGEPLGRMRRDASRLTRDLGAAFAVGAPIGPDARMLDIILERSRTSVALP